jgi:farnesyl-diphosphate farnesyltransferase
MFLKQTATEILKQTSRTFYLSIMQLPARIREAVMSSYLLLRAIDEIEDHPELEKPTKVSLLCAVSTEIGRGRKAAPQLFAAIFRPHREQLHEVTYRIDEWLALTPEAVAPVVHRAASVMAQRMAYWVNNDWLICNKRDLDRYTFGVAGAVGVLLSDLWAWYDGTPSRKTDAICCGRGLQAVNMLRNRSEDLERGVDFFPNGWSEADFIRYAKNNLLRGEAYVDGLPPGPAYEFCRGPLALAHATLDALERGESKLSRSVVLEILKAKDSTAYRDTDEEKVVLVNHRDEAIGVEEKIRAHRLGALHRAFSVFVFNADGKLLLQKRTAVKYHSRGLWSNTCCGHPRPGETIEKAAQRRLSEEMGFDTELRQLFHFIYHARLEDSLIEHEVDHVFIGHFDGVPKANSTEVAEWKWMDLATLGDDLAKHPESYTYWFRISFERVVASARSNPVDGTLTRSADA